MQGARAQYLEARQTCLSKIGHNAKALIAWRKKYCKPLKALCKGKGYDHWIEVLGHVEQLLQTQSSYGKELFIIVSVVLEITEMLRKKCDIKSEEVRDCFRSALLKSCALIHDLNGRYKLRSIPQRHLQLGTTVYIAQFEMIVVLSPKNCDNTSCGNDISLRQPLLSVVS